MFTVKATHRGETRKLSFDYTTSFPTYDELCSQLYRVFPINNDYHLSRLLFSPNAASPAQILIATEIHSQDDYQNAVQPYGGRVYPNALLRFSVYDDTPHKQPSSRSSMYASPALERTVSTFFTPPPPPPPQSRQSTSSDSDKRPTVPPKPAELFLPFEYISALSGRPTHSNRSSLHIPQATMDVDKTPQSSPAQPTSMTSTEAETTSQSSASTPTSRSSTLLCCSTAQAKEEIRALITSFEKEVNQALEKGFGSPTAPQVSIALSEPTCSPASRPTIRKSSAVDLGGLFANGAFPSNGPTRRASTRSGPARRASLRNSKSSSSLHSQASGCLGASSASQSGRPLPQVPEQVVHTHVVCDTCLKTVIGVRHKCLDCPDFDLCSDCIKDGAAEKHNPFHEFFEIKEPGRVIVHTVFSDNERSTGGEAASSTSATAIHRTVTHAAYCDLCESSIAGVRYKCCNCPDFDTCETCFKITPEQHPKHSFFKIEKPEAYVRNGPVDRKAHFARCDSCTKTIWGTRYKCMHPECPDFDLCERCEALPIAVHPPVHPLLKMKVPDVVIPTVYRVGGTEIIAAKEPVANPSLDKSSDYRPSYLPREGYSPVYLTKELSNHTFDDVIAETPLVAPVPVPAEGENGHVHEEERAATPRPNQDKSQVSEKDVDALNPFADPPMIGPIGSMTGSMVSSFTATVEDIMNGVSTSSPLSEVAARESSLFEGFLDRSAVLDETQDKKEPSFVNDVLEDFFKTVGTSFSRPEESTGVEIQEKGDDETLSALVSGVGRLVAMVAGEAPASPPVKEKEVEEPQTPVEEEPKIEEQLEVTPERTAVKDEFEDIPAPVFSAGFISDVTVPDGQVFPPGAEFMKCWRMVNDGHVDWPESTEVVFVAGQSGLVAAGSEAVKVGAVKAGDEADVWTGELKAPEAAGRYVGYWRLRDGETREVFGNSIWVEIQVAETDHHLNDETSSMSGSSIVRMPTRLGSAEGSLATSVRPPQSLTLTIPSSASTSMDGESDIGSDASLVDYMSDGEVVAWEDARSGVDGARARSPAPVVAPGSPLGDEFELVYDSSSDM